MKKFFNGQQIWEIICHFASAKWQSRRIRLRRMHLPFALAKWQSLWRMQSIRQRQCSLLCYKIAHKSLSIIQL